VPISTKAHSKAPSQDTADDADVDHSKSKSDSSSKLSLTMTTDQAHLGVFPNTLGLAGLNRKQMEEERLSRLSQKRKRDEAETDAKVVEPPPSKLHRQANVTHPKSVQDAASRNNPSQTGLQYPNGVIKRTWAFGFPRDGDEIKIEEVIQKQNLELAILSAFQVDVEWITSKLRPDTR